MHAPDSRSESAATRLARAAEERGLAAASRAGRGDEPRGLSTLGLAAASALFVCLYLPWVGGFSAWTLWTGSDSGLVAFALVLVELLFLAGAWVSRPAVLVAFCLTAAAGVMGITTWITFRWSGSHSASIGFDYGAWLGFVASLVLIALAALRLSALWRRAP